MTPPWYSDMACERRARHTAVTAAQRSHVYSHVDAWQHDDVQRTVRRHHDNKGCLDTRARTHARTSTAFTAAQRSHPYRHTDA
jgi:hypothetical protein